MTVSELLRRMTSSEMIEWMAYFKIEQEKKKPKK